MAEAADLMQDLLTQLDLETLEDRLFRGVSRNLGGHSVFGGQVAGQALVAATRTVGVDPHAHSLHGYFIRPGEMDAALVSEAEIAPDGPSVATRRVPAVPPGQPTVTRPASSSLSEAGCGPEHRPT